MSTKENTLFINRLRKLALENVHVVGYACRQRMPFNSVLSSLLHVELKGVREFIPPKIKLGPDKRHLNPNLILTLHEDCNALYTVNKLAEIFDVKSLAILQLPPFYRSMSRLKRMYTAYRLWLDIQYKNNRFRKYAMLSYDRFINHVVDHKREKLLQRFDGIVAVSKAIPVEMGGEWVNRIVSLDPGVSLDEEDLSLIHIIRTKAKAKRNCIIFGGRPLPLKGLIEGLLAFKYILKEFPNLKMIITGNINKSSLTNVLCFCKKLGIENKVIFTGFVSRRDRFMFVNESKLMLYPSHFDAFPYAVCESLHLGTPVVAYKIPALEIYYGKTEGVRLVDEGDVETLAREAINMLENKTRVEAPKIKEWNEIMQEEISHIERILGEANFLA